MLKLSMSNSNIQKLIKFWKRTDSPNCYYFVLSTLFAGSPRWASWGTCGPFSGRKWVLSGWQSWFSGNTTFTRDSEAVHGDTVITSLVGKYITGDIHMLLINALHGPDLPSLPVATAFPLDRKHIGIWLGLSRGKEGDRYTVASSGGVYTTLCID